MKPRTIFILIAMMVVVLATSAFGVYNDREIRDDTVKRNKPVAATPVIASAASLDDNTVVGASGASTSYKSSKSHLDVSEKADGPHSKDGTNTYRGKASGYDLHSRGGGGDVDSDGGDSDGDGGSDAGDDNNDANQSEFQKKMKYVSNMFEEIFSKWKSQETIMAPSGIEELVDPDEGFKIREKFKRGARQGMRKLKNAFRGRSNK
jgi:flagellar basal body-associated protein FliL